MIELLLVRLASLRGLTSSHGTDARIFAAERLDPPGIENLAARLRAA